MPDIHPIYTYLVGLAVVYAVALVAVERATAWLGRELKPLTCMYCMSFWISGVWAAVTSYTLLEQLLTWAIVFFLAHSWHRILQK